MTGMSHPYDHISFDSTHSKCNATFQHGAARAILRQMSEIVGFTRVPIEIGCIAISHRCQNKAIARRLDLRDQIKKARTGTHRIHLRIGSCVVGCDQRHIDEFAHFSCAREVRHHGERVHSASAKLRSKGAVDALQFTLFVVA